MTPRVLKNIPVYIEKYTSFNSNKTPSVLLQLIDKSLNQYVHINYEVCYYKHKIKGIVYSTCGYCTFKTQLYKDTTSEDIVCEFQRRYGCVITFTHMYRLLLGHMYKLGCIQNSTTIHNTSTSTLLPYMNHIPIINIKTAENLLSMSACENIDTQREGTQGILSTIYWVDNQEIFIQFGQSFLLLLSQLLTSCDYLICRNGCVIMSYISLHTDIKIELINICMDSICHVLQLHHNFETYDSTRHIFVVLYNLMEFSDHVVNHPLGHHCVNSLYMLIDHYKYKNNSTLKYVYNILCKKFSYNRVP